MWVDDVLVQQEDAEPVEKRALPEAGILAGRRDRKRCLVGPRPVRERDVEFLRHQSEVAERVDEVVSSSGRLVVGRGSVIPEAPPALWHDVLDVELRGQGHNFVTIGSQLELDASENRSEPLLLDVAVGLHVGELSRQCLVRGPDASVSSLGLEVGNRRVTNAGPGVPTQLLQHWARRSDPPVCWRAVGETRTERWPNRRDCPAAWTREPNFHPR